MGIHGERGVIREKLLPADAIVDHIMDRIFSEMNASPGDRVAVLVNSFGSTPLMELYVLFRRVEQRLSAKHITIEANWVGHYCTSLDMNGASISVMHLDQRIIRSLIAPLRYGFSSGQLICLSSLMPLRRFHEFQIIWEVKMQETAARHLGRMFQLIAFSMKQEKERLSDLDGAIGDADHGITMVLGFSAVNNALAKVDLEQTLPSEVFFHCRIRFSPMR